MILEQVKYLLSLEDIDQATRKDQIDKLKARIKVVKSKDLSLQTPSTSLPLGLPASYWLDLRNYKPAQAANEIPRPMLILQGARDYQITTEDFDGWKKALSSHKDVKLILYPALNHLFVEGKGKSKPQEYNVPGHVAEVVINDIAGWINSINSR